jgi:predicted nucleic acid-binding protein
LFEVIEKKFPDKTPTLENFLAKIPYETVITSGHANRSKYIQIRDKNDETILISAIEANVDLFITGDKDFLEINLSKPIILTPKEFLDNY